MTLLLESFCLSCFMLTRTIACFIYQGGSFAAIPAARRVPRTKVILGFGTFWLQFSSEQWYGWLVINGDMVFLFKGTIQKFLPYSHNSRSERIVQFLLWGGNKLSGFSSVVCFPVATYQEHHPDLYTEHESLSLWQTTHPWVPDMPKWESALNKPATR